MTGSLQVKNGMYYAVLNMRGLDGKRMQKWIPLNIQQKGGKKKAEAMLAELILQYEGINAVEAEHILLSDHLLVWAEHQKNYVTYTTWQEYMGMINIHIKPYFDAKRITLAGVTPGDLEDYYRYKVFQGLSPNTVIKHHAIIRTSLQWAMKHQKIKYNAADLADKPKRVKYQANDPYTVEEIAQLLELTKYDPISVPIFICAFYGLRRSEAIGLTWSAVNFKTGWITIDTTVVKETHNGKVINVVRNSTKTQYSKRVLPLCKYTYDYLMRLKQYQLGQQSICGDGYNKEYLDFLCVDPVGNLLTPDYVSHRFGQILKMYNLRPIRFHDLRHSCATIMLHLGYNLKDIQTWLGHANFNFTAQTYIHSSKEDHMRMADTLSGYLPPLFDEE